MVGRLVLPVFGGAPAVWATVLLFFQALLLCGYAYAHLLATRLGPLRGAVVHVVVVTAAAIATLAAPRDVAALHDPSLPVIPALLGLLLVVIGPAAFAMTATTPLVSAWYARVRRAADPTADPRDPYWLYALSNGGSLVSLLAYPLLIEPRLGLGLQRALWGAGFVLLAGLILLSAWRLRVGTSGDSTLGTSSHAPTTTVAPPPDPMPPPTAREKLTWLALAAVPAGMLSAVTNLVTTDLIAAPLLWVIPLATYLGSFVVAFSARGRRLVPLAVALAPATLTLLWVPIGSVAGWPLLVLLVIEYAGLGLVAVAIHGRLAERRPGERHLTAFYLVMSAGGVTGGAFVALLAPVAFDGVWEYPILVAAAFWVLALTAPAAPGRRRPLARLVEGWPRRLVPFAIIGGATVAWMLATDAPGAALAARTAVLGGLLLLVGGLPRALALGTTVALAVAVFAVPSPVLVRDRSFFGVVEVLRDSARTVLMHGTTRHGSQWVDPAIAMRPLDYYAPSGPVGDLFAAWAPPGGGQIRVMGLGAGALAAYLRPGDRLVFYEIDPLVADVASDARWFTFLADATAPADVRLGDGRLLLEEEADDSLDLVIMDAFSSDSVPAHLITEEAFEEVDRVLRDDGVVAVHVSNRYYALTPPVATALARRGLTVLERAYAPSEAEAPEGGTATRFLVGTRNPDVAASLTAAGWTQPRTSATPLTDDFPDLLRYLSIGGP